MGRASRFDEWQAEYMQALGQRLRDLREERGLRQADFQDFGQASVDQVHYRSIEAGRRNVTLRTLLRLCWRMDVSPHEILPDIDPPKTKDPGNDSTI